jgi:hemerythrin-like domain-containing protein
MQKLLETLEAEHRRIESVLHALEAFAPMLNGAAGNLHELIRFMTFLRGYVDGYHHEREETVLLPALISTGFNADVGPIAHIREQHREEARLLLRFEMAASAPPPWDPPTIRAVTDAALAFVTFSRAHMEKEQSLLFPVAERDLATAPDLDKLLRRFELHRAPRWNVPWLEHLGTSLTASHTQ